MRLTILIAVIEIIAVDLIIKDQNSFSKKIILESAKQVGKYHSADSKL
jgi:hypothetical protein